MREILPCLLVGNATNARDVRQIYHHRIAAVVDLVQGNVVTLVACSAGMSRAPAITAAVLAQLTDKPLDDCLLEVVLGGPCDISPRFWNQVCQAFRARR